MQLSRKWRTCSSTASCPDATETGGVPAEHPEAVTPPRGHEDDLRRLSRPKPIRWRFSVPSSERSLDLLRAGRPARRKEASELDLAIFRMLGKMPTIAAFSHKQSIGQPFVYPQNRLSYCQNFLQMMFAVPTEEYEPDHDFVKALNLLLILHADHGQNCSTSAVRMVGSSGVNLFSSISSGICAPCGEPCTAEPTRPVPRCSMPFSPKAKGSAT